MNKRVLVRLWLVLALAVSFPALCSAQVAVTPMEGVVGQTMEEHLGNAVAAAEEMEAELLVLEIDTPGGLVSSMREIVQRILNAPLPVVVWVAPTGARAASAGAFIVQASHVAAMSEGTNIGAAHPVTTSGGDISEEMNKKITNDLAAQMRSLAEQRGRNEDVAARMVTESISLTATEALEAGVVDLVASDRESLLASLDGRVIDFQGGERTLRTEGEAVSEIPVDPKLKILGVISRPDIAYLLLVAGAYAILFEVLSPGGFVMGVSGGVMILLGAFGLRMLPFNWAGIVLLVAGIAVMITDLLVGSLGVLSLFGAAALAVGGLILFRAPGGELLHFSYEVVIGGVAVLTIFFLVVIWAVLRSMRGKVQSGAEGLAGSSGTVTKALEPEGFIMCHGEYWRAVSEDGETISDGTVVRVVRMEGLKLIVRAEEGNLD
ncbi:MAG: nodulation protein NfeD [Synergistales bacterium]|nr:nodulation protein NfeD [Synergistales bacterium]